MALTKDAILGAEDSNVTAVSVPEWQGEVSLRVISGTARAQLEAMMSRRQKDNGSDTLEGVRGWLLVRSICDETGDLVFDQDDADALEAKSAIVIDRLFDAAVAHSKLWGDTDDNPFGDGQSLDSGSG